MSYYFRLHLYFHLFLSTPYNKTATTKDRIKILTLLGITIKLQKNSKTKSMQILCIFRVESSYIYHKHQYIQE